MCIVKCRWKFYYRIRKILRNHYAKEKKLGISCIVKCRWKCIEPYTVLIRKILQSYSNHYAKEKKLLVTHTFSLGCSSVIEYSRNLIWPRSIFFISSVWCWFSYGVLINSNNVWIWGIIQISKIFARLWQFSFLFYMCYNFLLMTRSLGCA